MELYTLATTLLLTTWKAQVSRTQQLTMALAHMALAHIHTHIVWYALLPQCDTATTADCKPTTCAKVLFTSCSSIALLASQQLLCVTYVRFLQVIVGVQQAQNAKTASDTMMAKAVAASAAGNATEAFEYMQQSEQARKDAENYEGSWVNEATALLAEIPKRCAEVVVTPHMINPRLC
jgi:hypothetical protein